MRFLLDTNVVSELRKGERANPGVRGWFEEVDARDLALSVLVLGEIRLGILRVGRRDPIAAKHLGAWLIKLEQAYEGRTLAVDSEVVRSWAHLSSLRPLPVIDSLQAATADVHGLTFVTRNVADLDSLPLRLLDPFSA